MYSRSRMNFGALLLHGFGAISIYSEIVFVRMLICAMIVGILAIGAIIAVVIVRLFTDLAIPGWATTAVGMLLVILLQAILLFLGALFLLLQDRTRVLPDPEEMFSRYIVGRRTVCGRE